MTTPVQDMLIEILSRLTNLSLRDLSTVSGLDEQAIVDALARLSLRGLVTRVSRRKVKTGTRAYRTIDRYALVVEDSPEMRARQERLRRRRVRAVRQRTAQAYRQSEERSAHLRRLWSEADVPMLKAG